MLLKDELLINMYGQGLVEKAVIMDRFDLMDVNEQSNYINDLFFLLLQSKPTEGDIEPAVFDSKLKPTHTPCVLLRKGVSSSNLEKIIGLPKNEYSNVLKLLLSLFKISYSRRFELEKNDPNKWWYWDLSDEKKYQELKRLLSI